MTRPERRPSPVRRGYIMIALLLAGAVLIFNLQPLVDLTRRTIDVVAVVADAPGVQVGTEVWVEGVKVGRVKNVALMTNRDTTLVALDLRMQRSAVAVVTVSSDVRASRRRFIAEPVVRVFAGSPADPPLQPGDTLRGQPRLAGEQLIAKLEALAPTMDSVLREARMLQLRFDERQPAFEELAARIQATTAAVTALTAQVEGGTLG